MLLNIQNYKSVYALPQLLVKEAKIADIPALSMQTKRISLKTSQALMAMNLKPINISGISNFHMVEKNLFYRGAKPNAKGIRYLSTRGVKTIVDLRDYYIEKLPKEMETFFKTHNSSINEPEKIQFLKEYFDKTSQKWYLEALEEKCNAERFGMKWINMPIPARTIPKEQQISELFKMFENPDNGPIYIHCLEGKDRTGIMVALYRVLRQGLGFEQACQDMSSKGYRVDGGYPNLFEFLRNQINSASNSLLY